MCAGLSCAVVGCHGNGNKLKNSFKVLVLHIINMLCPALYALLAELTLKY